MQTVAGPNSHPLLEISGPVVNSRPPLPSLILGVRVCHTSNDTMPPDVAAGHLRFSAYTTRASTASGDPQMAGEGHTGVEG